MRAESPQRARPVPGADGTRADGTRARSMGAGSTGADSTGVAMEAR
jgi:hypothetical protein